ncbi:MAG TPA: hypothetical protein VK390_16000 [Propionibacteriaceae bacterium]|nr:hypothetical protein [Propionibacteriaceae bacterium]
MRALLHQVRWIRAGFRSAHARQRLLGLGINASLFLGAFGRRDLEEMPLLVQRLLAKP